MHSIKPIAYAARSLHKSEIQYSQIEKEALGIIFAVQKFHKYIFGRSFTLQTDHKPLLSIFGSKKGIPIYTANRLQRWATNLLAYNFNIQYINTDSFAYVYFLSRLINQHVSNTDEIIIASLHLEHQILQIINSNLQTFPVNYEQLVEVYSEDSTMQRLINYISNDWNDFSSSDDSDLQQFYNRRESLSISNNIILFGDRVIIPTSLREIIIKQLHNGHPGITKMKNLARSYVYWPNIDKQIENFVKFCSKCALFGKSPTKTLLHSWPIPSQPWERLHIDYAGPFKGSHFLIVIDAYSKWPEIIKTATTTSTKTLNILSSIFGRFGTPSQLVSDNGSQFTSEQFQTFCNINGIEHLRTSPYHPMSNGQAERFVNTFKRAIKKLESEGKLDENLEVFLKTYRTTPNNNCPFKKSPAEILLGRKVRTVFDLLKPFNISTQNRNIKMEQQFNQKHGAKHREFNIDDKIFVKIHKNNSWFWQEGIITERIGEVNYNISTEGRTIQAHTNQIKMRFNESNDNNDQLSISTLTDLFESESTPSTS